MVVVLMLFLALLVAAAIYLVRIYNGLVALRENVRKAWSNIDVLLTQRHDELPKLVETCKRYMAYERETLERVMQARSAVFRAQGQGDVTALGAAEGQLRAGLGRLFAVAENYPQLRAAENFLSLQKSLSEIEEALQNARRYYNAVVRDLNIAVQSFPANLLAGALGFQPRAFFEIESVTERQPAPVKF